MSVKLRPLAPGDLVLRKVLGNTKNPAWGKLGGTISHYDDGRNRSLLLRRFRRKGCTSSLECKQSEKILLLIRKVMVVFFFLAFIYPMTSIEILNRN